MRDEDESYPPVWLCILIAVLGTGIVWLAPILKGTLKITTWGIK